jgi:transferase CAF17, mitochondrial
MSESPAKPAYILLADRAVLEVAGADRRSFLQGLISNDIEKVTPHRAIHSALLTAQGKYLHDFFVAELGDAFYLDGEAARLADLKRRLGLYKLRAKVTIGEAGERFAVGAAVGAGALESLGLENERGEAEPFAGGVAYVDPRLAALGARVLLPRAAGVEPLAAKGFVAADGAAYDRLRLSLGVPDGSRDLEVEKAILLEAGFDELAGVDWQKGCYVGQELTARMKHRGGLRKRVLPVQGTMALPAPGRPIEAGGQEIGRLIAAQGIQGLALIRLDRLDESQNMPLVADGVGISVSWPSWMPR